MVAEVYQPKRLASTYLSRGLHIQDDALELCSAIERGIVPERICDGDHRRTGWQLTKSAGSTESLRKSSPTGAAAALRASDQHAQADQEQTRTLCEETLADP